METPTLKKEVKTKDVFKRSELDQKMMRVFQTREISVTSYT
jgi:hypothetical protein